MVDEQTRHMLDGRVRRETIAITTATIETEAGPLSAIFLYRLDGDNIFRELPAAPGDIRRIAAELIAAADATERG